MNIEVLMKAIRITGALLTGVASIYSAAASDDKKKDK